MVVAPHSVTPLYSQAILQAAERRGIRLPTELTNELQGGARVPLAVQDELWDAYCAASADPLAGLRLGLGIQVGHLDTAGLLLVICDTLGEALELLVEYAPAIGDGGDFSLRRDKRRVCIDYQPHLTVRQAERVEAVLAIQLNLTCWATGGRFRPDGLWLAHAPLADQSAYRALIDCPLRFGAQCNSLVFDAGQLSLPLIQANSVLRDQLQRLADRTLAELGQHSLSAAVQRAVRAHPRWGKERVAEQLNLSGRHLNRKLAIEGQSFKTLRQGVLQEMACHALQGTDRGLAQIAESLGFSDENAFTRAFRRWHGVTPARFRSRIRAAD